MAEEQSQGHQKLDEKVYLDLSASLSFSHLTFNTQFPIDNLPHKKSQYLSLGSQLKLTKLL